MKKVISDHKLLQRLGALPREIKPDRDVWPAIAQRIGHKETSARQRLSTRWWKYAVAASVTVVFAGGVVTGRHWDTGSDLEQPGLELAAQSQALEDNDTVVALTASELEYQAAFREFISVGESRENLPQGAVENLVAGWADLSEAEAALTKALQDNPGNSFLNMKLLELRSRQLDFLMQIASLDQSNRRSTI
jgi:hypothetical protein